MYQRSKVKSHHPLRRSIFAAALIVTSTLSGCGKPTVVSSGLVGDDPTASSLMIIGQAYKMANARLQRPPAKFEELKIYLKDVAKDNKRNYEDYLKSPRDGQPFEIIYGVNVLEIPVDPNDLRPLPVYAHERLGQAGKRWVIRLMSPQELTDDEFAHAIVPKNVAKAK
jgi:hypothetical protein